MDEPTVEEFAAICAKVRCMSVEQLEALMKQVEHEHQLATQYDTGDAHE